MKLKDAGIYDMKKIFKGEMGNQRTACPNIINIPAYQRPYKWKTENISRIFTDYEESGKGSQYFLGAAVVVEKDDNVKDVVDGQQRLTTIYLINFVRFLLQRELIKSNLESPDYSSLTSDLNKLEETFVDLISSDKETISSIMDYMKTKEDEINDNPKEKDKYCDERKDFYKKLMCLVDNKSTEKETYSAYIESMRMFYENKNLCLQYSRDRYNEFLRETLINTWIESKGASTQYVLKVFCSEENYNEAYEGEFKGHQIYDNFYFKNYCEAIKDIFEQVSNQIEPELNKNPNQRNGFLRLAIKYLDSLLDNLSLCVVTTDNANDATKLFEVLNDRALEVEDIESIKNLFYKYFCTKSNLSDEKIDKEMMVFDEIWTDKIFDDLSSTKTMMISYLATSFLTKDENINPDGKFKTNIGKYLDRYVDKNNEFTINDLRKHFNVYLGIKIFIDKFDIKFTKFVLNAFKTEAEHRKSITYKTVSLLKGLKYIGVIAALSNVIMAKYSELYDISDVDFENNFAEFLDNLIDEAKSNEEKYKCIHDVSYALRTAALFTKDFEEPRRLAKIYISQNGLDSENAVTTQLSHSDLSKIRGLFDEWISQWNYSNSSGVYKIKIILINLFYTNKNGNVITFSNGLEYTLNADNLQLDHLEANNIGTRDPNKYFMSEDILERTKILNSSLGNFMIIDGRENNSKKNLPMIESKSFYEHVKNAWLVQEIRDMMNDPQYFDIQKGVPKKEFFDERSKRLIRYFGAYLNNPWNSNSFNV